MSAADTERIAQEEDHVRLGPALVLIALSLAMIAIGVVWPWLYLGARGLGVAPATQGAARSDVPPVVGGLRASALVIAPVAGGDGRRAPAPSSAERFAWADRERGLVRLPTDAAIDLWLERTVASAAPQGRP